MVQIERTNNGLVPASAPPPDEAFAVTAEYIADTDPSKVNLGLGVYRTEEGQPWPLPTVQIVENAAHAEANPARHEYLTIQGDPAFLGLARDLAFDLPPVAASGSGSPDAGRSRIVSAQTVSGTGANHMGAKYLTTFTKPRCVWVPDPTWGNHFVIWELVDLPVRTYPYFDAATRGINFAGLLATLSRDAEPGDVVLLHACAHNPTGADPTHDQWRQIADVCESRGLVPFFDLAYQGFASGDPSQDAWAVQHFFSRPQLEFLLAQSFSKNFGIYGQRAGALHIAIRQEVAHTDAPSIVKANLCHLIRGEYSMAPRGGSDIVRRVLEVPALRDQWKDDLRTMSGRIKAMRQALYDELVRLGTPGSWTHVISQIGMFSYTGLTEAQVLAVRQKHHIYMLLSGRISISGLTEKNVAHVAAAFDDVVRTIN